MPDAVLVEGLPILAKIAAILPLVTSQLSRGEEPGKLAHRQNRLHRRGSRVWKKRGGAL